ncbi:MAG TPA: DUF2145 domain-containing protein [Usitatibacter sp.]|nr:DUF2145 domain-containing protein [Usitatibacter sp.]
MSSRWAAPAAMLLLPTAVLAGRPCTDTPLDVDTVKRSLALAEHTAARLDATGARVVVLGRAGQDLGKYGLRWSHMAFAYRDDEDGAMKWRVVHKLNECGAPVGDVYRQGLGDFFLDRMFRYEAAVVVLSAEAQARLLPVLRDDRRVMQWSTRAYSMVAYPWSTRYQQSNQWVLETLAGAMDGHAATRRQAQAWLQLRDYRPTTLRLGPLERLGAEVSRANIAFDDHPNAKRFSDRIETATVDSALAWLPASGVGEEPIYVR